MIANAKAVRKAKQAGLPSENIDLERVYRRHKGMCGICDRPVPAHEVSWDHVIPIDKGGSHLEANIQPAHAQCNSVKGNRSLEWARQRIKLFNLEVML